MLVVVGAFVAFSRRVQIVREPRVRLAVGVRERAHRLGLGFAGARRRSHRRCAALY